MPVYESVIDTVGRTPLIHLRRISDGLAGRILGKMESRNPCGSIKDRIGLAMVRDAEERGVLKPGATIVEATSGNTGIALAYVAAALGYKLVITMPENMSPERVAMLKLFGVEVVLTPGGLMRGAVDKARELCKELPDAVMLEQFKNPANPDAHRRGTAREIIEDTDGKVDAFVAGVGTGGTVTGVGTVLKEELGNVHVVAVEPADSAVLSGEKPGPHFIQGIGAGFVPEVLDRSVIDEIMPMSDRAATDMCARLAREEGILAGISSGAALAAAVRVARRADMKGKTVVVVLPDTGERYLSS